MKEAQSVGDSRANAGKVRIQIQNKGRTVMSEHYPPRAAPTKKEKPPADEARGRRPKAA